jgi:hypothetical protein
MVTVRPVLAVATAALALAACGGGGSAAPATVTVTQPGAASTSGAASASGSASAPPTSAAASPSSSAAAGGAGDAGKTFDAPTQKATVTTKEDGKEIQLTIGPVQIVTGSLGDLKNYKLPATVKGQVPIYVTGTFTHAGGPAVRYPYFMSAMFMENAAGERAGGITLLGTFDKCESPKPATFAEGDTTKQCRVYLLPKGDKPGKLFGSWAGFGQDKYVTWLVR